MSGFVKNRAFPIGIVMAALFALFLVWIVYLADSGRGFFLFDLAKSIPYGDKAGHFLLSSLFTLFLNAALRFKTFQTGLWQLPYGSLLVFLVVAAEESSQHFIPGRTCDITDLAADVCGIVITSLFLYPRKPAPNPTLSL